MLPKLLRAEKDKVVERKNNMSKYNLTDILNEYIGGGRIGTLKISYKDLVDKMDELEKSGKVIVREKGSSADGKVNREFEVVDRDSAVPGGRKQERGFTVYDYKFGFDPGSEDKFIEEYDFSVGGNDLQLAMDLIDGVKPYRFEENIKEDEFDEARQAAIESSQKAAGIKEGYIGDENYEDQRGSADQKLWVLVKLKEAGIIKNEAEYKKALKAVDHVSAGQLEEENVIKDLAQADEVIKMIKMMNPDVREDLLMRIARMGQKMDENRREKNPEGMGQLYVQPAVQKAVKFHLDAYDKGDIDVDDMIQAIEDIIFGYVKAPGMSEQMYIDDEEFEMEMGRSKKDSLKKEMIIHVDQLIDGNIDMNDFMNVVEEIMAELKSMKEVMNIDRKGKKKPDSEDGMISKAKKSMKENGDVNDYLDELSEENSKKVKIRAYLKDYYTNPKDPKDVRIDDKLIDEFFEFTDDNSINIENMDMDDIVREYDEFIFLNKDVMEDVRKQFKRFM